MTLVHHQVIRVDIPVDVIREFDGSGAALFFRRDNLIAEIARRFPEEGPLHGKMKSYLLRIPHPWPRPTEYQVAQVLRFLSKMAQEWKAGHTVRRLHD